MKDQRAWCERSEFYLKHTMRAARWMSFLIVCWLVQQGCASINLPPGLAGREQIVVDAPQNRKILAVVARPKGDGPFPIVVVLHGTDGLRQRYVKLGEQFARQGFVAVTGCWFGGHYFFRGKPDFSGNAPHDDAIACPQGPSYKYVTIEATNDVAAIIEEARKLPGVRPDRVGLFGHSRGGMIALLTASQGRNVQAVVASAAFYLKRRSPDTPPILLAETLASPVLLLHGTKDQLVDIQELPEYERTLRNLAKSVEIQIYEGAPHDLPFERATQDDVFQRAVTFFQKHLR